MKHFIIGAALVAALAGCTDLNTQYPDYEPDQAVRRQVFKECLEALPAGPQSTKYNDWDEVVAECGSVAYYQSLVCVKNCPAMPGKSQ